MTAALWLLLIIANAGPPCRCGHSPAQHQSNVAALLTAAMRSGSILRPCLARHGWRRRRCHCPDYMTQARFDSQLAEMAKHHS